jgi:hypothetical protein
MPYAPRKIVKPEIFLRHNGRIIYHTYRNDEMEEGPLTFSFTTSTDDFDFEWRFDVRELPSWLADPFPSSPLDYIGPSDSFIDEEHRHIRKIIKRAIDTGEITFEES